MCISIFGVANKTEPALTRVHCNTSTGLTIITISMSAKMKSLEKYIVAIMYVKERERERKGERERKRETHTQTVSDRLTDRATYAVKINQTVSQYELSIIIYSK